MKILKARENAVVYVDAGNARWVPPEDMAARLIKAGLEYADGFSLNVSNYVATDETLAYGKKISTLTGGAHFVIDTGRNGNGAAPENEWCNPEGERSGIRPSSRRASPRATRFSGSSDPASRTAPATAARVRESGGPSSRSAWLSARSTDPSRPRLHARCSVSCSTASRASRRGGSVCATREDECGKRD